MINKIKNIFSLLGPGLLYAGAAIGVSHLVSSTQAGALYNYQFIIIALAVHLVKYPFFKFGPLYTSVTEQNILHGYKKIGSWTIYFYIVLSLISMCIIQGAVTIVTAGLLSQLVPIGIGVKTWVIVLLIVGGLILVLGHYKFLENISKYIVLSLSIITIIALALLLGKENNSVVNPPLFSFLDKSSLVFFILFVGWMPAPMEVSIWHSIWAEKKRQSIKNTLLDFKVGFIGTALLALIFIMLGAKTIYGSGLTIPTKAGEFANFFIHMYEKALGFGSLLITIIAFLTMFSTTITCLDASARSLEEAYKISTNKKISTYKCLLLFNILGSVVIIIFFLKDMKSMIQLATTLAFISAPIYALFNLLAITHKDIVKRYKVTKKEIIYASFCIVILVTFNLIYIFS